mmetsp:Transcript_14830/g.27850  ORF Transcript_14830/g.27850 Transcript_14830/m.27850 type:complete len:86 (+) Transcript_14830:267-524(+)
MCSEDSPKFTSRRRRTGNVFEELYMWHNAKCLSFEVWTQPLEHWENPESKSRCNGLLVTRAAASDIIRQRGQMAKQWVTRLITDS